MKGRGGPYQAYALAPGFCMYPCTCVSEREGEAEKNRERILHSFGSAEICGLGCVTRVCEYGTPRKRGVGIHSPYTHGRKRRIGIIPIFLTFHAGKCISIR